MLSTVLMSTAAFTYHAGQLAKRARVDGLARLSEGALIVLHEASRVSEERREAMWAELRRFHPDLSAALLADRAGTVLFSRGDLELFSSAVQTTPGTAVGNFQCWWPGDPGASPKAAKERVIVTALAARQLGTAGGDGVLLLAFAERPRTWWGAYGVWLVSATLMAVGFGGSFLGVWVWIKHLVSPLRRISEEARAAAERSGTASEPAAHQDEISRLAQAFRDIQVNLAEWRQRAARLERTMDRRISEQTRRIHEELNRAERKAWTDPLTGLANRRLFDEKIEDIVAAERSRGHDMSMVIIDIDHFKLVNDTLGHPAGDELLRFTAELLSQCLRGNDLAIRMGGDEFLLVLPSTCALDASSVAQRTLGLFSQRAKLLDVSPKPSLSAGVASLQESGATSAAELLRLADEALYSAKRSGKCQVAVHEKPKVTGTTMWERRRAERAAK